MKRIHKKVSFIEEEEDNADKTCFLSDKHAVDRLRRLCRIVLRMSTVCRSLARYAQAANIDYTSLQVAFNRTKSKDLKFTARDYKRSAEFCWPPLYLNSLLAPPEYRNAHDIVSIQKGMRTLHGFRSLPENVQRKICGAVIYQRYGRQRVIARCGHPVQNIYFVFSGVVRQTFVRTNADVNDADLESRTLEKGDIFGEGEFMGTGRRLANYECNEPCEMLLLHVDDVKTTGLHDVFLKRRRDIVALLRRNDLFYTWPDKAMEEMTSAGHVMSVMTNQIVDQTSYRPQWVWFVLKGATELWREVTPADLTNDLASKLKQTCATASRDVTPIHTSHRKVALCECMSHMYQHQNRSMGLQVQVPPTLVLPASDPSDLMWYRCAHVWIERAKKSVLFLDDVSRNASMTQTITTHLDQNALTIPSAVGGDMIPPDVQMTPSSSEKTSSPSRHKSGLHSSKHNTHGGKQRARTVFPQTKQGCMLSVSRTARSGIANPPKVLYFKVKHFTSGSFFSFSFVSRSRGRLHLVSEGSVLLGVPLSLFTRYQTPPLVQHFRDFLDGLPTVDCLVSQYIHSLRWKRFKEDFVRNMSNDKDEPDSPDKQRRACYYWRPVSVPVTSRQHTPYRSNTDQSIVSFMNEEERFYEAAEMPLRSLASGGFISTTHSPPTGVMSRLINSAPPRRRVPSFKT